MGKEDITILTKIANDDTLTNVGKVIKAYEEGLEDSKKELLEDLNEYLDKKYYRESEQGKSVISDLRSQLNKLSKK